MIETEERPNKSYYSTAAWNAKKGIVTPMTCALCPWTVVGTGPFHFGAQGRPVHVKCHQEAIEKAKAEEAKVDA